MGTYNVPNTHCLGYVADLTYIADSLGPGKFHVVVLAFTCNYLLLGEGR